MTKLDVIYCRVSTEEQAGENKTSLEEQSEKCTDYLKRLGYDNVQVFKEDYSGFEFDRPELDKIRELIAQDRVRSLTFWRVDRLTRKPGILEQLREGYFIKHGVEVHSPFDLGLWLWNPAHIHMQNSLVNFSEYWGRMLVQVMKDGKHGFVKKGNTLALGRPPLGYTEIKEDNRAYFVINETEASIVIRIFDMFVEQGLSLAKIAKIFTEEQIPTYTELRGKNPFKPNGDSKWYSATIKKILGNPVYVGKWEWGRKAVRKVGKEWRKTKNESTITVAVPRLVTDDTFEEAQKRLTENKKNKIGRETKHPYLLARRLTHHCGRKMGVTAVFSGKYQYYRCPTASGRLLMLPRFGRQIVKPPGSIVQTAPGCGKPKPSGVESDCKRSR